ncbi:MAG: inositol 2-dehydrogenase [Alphaproteobacteria bacterium]|nr:inositol 2-dehydrogenase [Alphaproteobacteria bacterium]
MSPLRLALVGAGRIGQVHAATIARNPDAHLVAFFEPNATLAQTMAESYSTAQPMTWQSILDDPTIDGVLICSPTNLHAEQIEQAVTAGKAVFCEKPIDLSVPRVVACLDHVREHKGRLMIGFNRRFDRHFLALREAAASIGQKELVTIVSRDPTPPPADASKWSGGIFKDMMIHDIDMARFMLDEPITHVAATGSIMFQHSIADYADYDTATATLTAASGALAVITNSRRTTYGYDQRIDVHGAEGTVTAENPRVNTVIRHGNTGAVAAPLFDFFTDRYRDAYAGELDHFIAAVRSGVAMTPSGADGLIALQIAEACIASAKSGHRITL